MLKGYEKLKENSLPLFGFHKSVWIIGKSRTKKKDQTASHSRLVLAVI